MTTGDGVQFVTASYLTRVENYAAKYRGLMRDWRISAMQVFYHTLQTIRQHHFDRRIPMILRVASLNQ
jgi:hypothetical protein